jgi:hypothetical protein
MTQTQVMTAVKELYDKARDGIFGFESTEYRADVLYELEQQYEITKRIVLEFAEEAEEYKCCY